MIGFDIWMFHFAWNPIDKTVALSVNGRTHVTVTLRHCDTEPLVREYCKSWAIELSIELSRAISRFDTKMPPEPRDRHL